jgi:hypothetical protein
MHFTEESVVNPFVICYNIHRYVRTYIDMYIHSYIHMYIRTYVYVFMTGMIGDDITYCA